MDCVRFVDIAEPKFSVNTIKLSHPSDVVKVSLYTPGSVKVFPLKTILPPEHTLCDMFVVGVGFIVTFNTKKLSHPNDVVNVSLYVPAVVMVLPLKLILPPWQILWDRFVVGVGLMVTFTVFVVAH